MVVRYGRCGRYMFMFDLDIYPLILEIDKLDINGHILLSQIKINLLPITFQADTMPALALRDAPLWCSGQCGVNGTRLSVDTV